MRKNWIRLASLGALIFGLGLVTPAFCGQITYSFSSVTDEGGEAGSFGLTLEFTLPEFNPGLGQLNGVSFDLNASFSGTTKYTNTSSTTSGDYELHASPALSASASTHEFFTLHAADRISVFGDIYPQGSATDDWGVLPGSENFYSLIDPLAYVGTGLVTFDVFAGLDSIYEFHDRDVQLNGLTMDPTHFTVDVTYDYSPSSSAPEPASTPCLIACVLAFSLYQFGWHRRRGRRVNGAGNGRIEVDHLS